MVAEDRRADDGQILRLRVNDRFALGVVKYDRRFPAQRVTTGASAKIGVFHFAFILAVERLSSPHRSFYAAQTMQSRPRALAS